MSPSLPAASNEDAAPDLKPITDANRLEDLITEALSKLGHKSRKRVAIFTHATPNPDAIGSQVAMGFLLAQKFGIDASCFVDGNVSHPQNKIVVQLLDPHLI